MRVLSIAVLALLWLPKIPASCIPPIPPTPTPSPTATPTPVPTPTPTPVPLCVIDFDRFELSEGGGADSGLDAAVKTAEINAHPGGCDSGRCVLNMPRPQWHYEVCRELQVAGFCCGFSDQDEITVGYTNTEGARVTNFHVFVGPGDGPGTVLWPPQARRDAWTLTPPPDPVDPPTQSSGDAVLCASDGGPVPRADGEPKTPWNIEKISRGECGYCGGLCDHTPRVWAGKDDLSDQEHHYCWLIGSQTGGHGNLGCPARMEGGDPEVRKACERVLLRGGPPKFKCSDGSEPSVCPSNPFQAACATGELSACTHDLAYCWGAS